MLLLMADLGGLFCCLLLLFVGCTSHKQYADIVYAHCSNIVPITRLKPLSLSLSLPSSAWIMLKHQYRPERLSTVQ
jgi:hypothetical protein